MEMATELNRHMSPVSSCIESQKQVRRSLLELEYSCRWGKPKSKEESVARDAAFLLQLADYPAWAIIGSLADYSRGDVKQTKAEGDEESRKMNPANYPIPSEIKAICELKVYAHNQKLWRIATLLEFNRKAN
jgi:hypothetical protein